MVVAPCLITSQLPVTTWHEVIGEPTLGDADLGSYCSQRVPARTRRPVDAQDQSQRGGDEPAASPVATLAADSKPAKGVEEMRGRPSAPARP